MKAFLITPLTDERAEEAPEVFEAVQRAIAQAVIRAGLELVHPASIARAGPIMRGQVEPEIEKADVVLALITGRNPNVFYELGFARREAILVCRSSDDVPFDIRDQRYWTYGRPEELSTLAQRLEEAIRQTLGASERQDRRRQRTEGPPVTCIETVAAFAGPTERGPETPVLITSPTEFVSVFGDWLSPEESYLGECVKGFFANGGSRAYVARVVSRRATSAEARVMATDERGVAVEPLFVQAVSQGFWGNRIAIEVRPGTRRGWRLTVVEGRVLGGVGREEDYDNGSLDPDGPNPMVERVNARSRLVRLRGPGTKQGALQIGQVILAG